MNIILIRGLLLLVATSIAAALILRIPPAEEHAEAGVSLSLPDRVNGFTGTDQDISEAERVILPKDTGFAKKIYTDAEGNQINCQIVLAGADHRSIHRPELCLEGQGWTVSGGEVIPIKLNSGREMEVMALTISRPVTAGNATKTLSALYLYWFVSNTTEVARHLDRVVRSNMDLLLHNRSNRWAYVIVSSPILQGFEPGGKDRAQTLDMLVNFIRSSVPHFQKSELTARPAAETATARIESPATAP